MEDKKVNISLLVLFFIPVIAAICGVFFDFSIMDLAYLIAVLILLLRYILAKE